MSDAALSTTAAPSPLSGMCFATPASDAGGSIAPTCLGSPPVAAITLA